MLSKDPLSLDRIRSILTRLEDTIIFSLIERAQFAHNPKIYERGVFKELEALNFNGSWLEWFLKETEIFHGAHAHRLFNTHSPTFPHSESTEIHKASAIACRVFLRLMCKIARMSIPSRQDSQIPSFRRPNIHTSSTRTRST